MRSRERMLVFSFFCHNQFLRKKKLVFWTFIVSRQFDQYNLFISSNTLQLDKHSTKLTNLISNHLRQLSSIHYQANHLHNPQTGFFYFSISIERRKAVLIGKLELEMSPTCGPYRLIGQICEEHRGACPWCLFIYCEMLGRGEDGGLSLEIIVFSSFTHAYSENETILRYAYYRKSIKYLSLEMEWVSSLASPYDSRWLSLNILMHMYMFVCMYYGPFSRKND